MTIIREHEAMFCGGVVHSFDGTREELGQVLQIDKLSIGINASAHLVGVWGDCFPSEVVAFDL